MNRRGFLESIIKAGAACAILPSALTYARQWKPRILNAAADKFFDPKIYQGDLKWIPNPEWINAEYEMTLLGHPLGYCYEGLPCLPRYSLVNGVFVEHKSHFLVQC